MKFTKEEAYKELVAKMTAKGEKLNLSERSIKEQLETLMPLVATDEMEMSDFIEKTLPLFKTADANVRNDVSVGINDYKANNPQTPPKTQEPNKNDDMTEIEKRLLALEERNRTLESENKKESIRKGLKAYLTAKGVKEEWISVMLAEITISEDTDVDKKGESLLGMYNTMYANTPKNVTPRGGGGANEDDQLSESIKSAAAYAKAQNLIE